MKFKLFLTDKDALDYIQTNYPDSIINECSAQDSECDDWCRIDVGQWSGETPALYVLNDNLQIIDKVAYLYTSNPNAYRLTVGDEMTCFDNPVEARNAFEVAKEAERYEEESRKITLMYSEYNRYSKTQETEIIEEVY